MKLQKILQHFTDLDSVREFFQSDKNLFTGWCIQQQYLNLYLHRGNESRTKKIISSLI